jgi:hypothetical protein
MYPKVEDRNFGYEI